MSDPVFMCQAFVMKGVYSAQTPTNHRCVVPLPGLPFPVKRFCATCVQ